MDEDDARFIHEETPNGIFADRPSFGDFSDGKMPLQERRVVVCGTHGSVSSRTPQVHCGFPQLLFDSNTALSRAKCAAKTCQAPWHSAVRPDAGPFRSSNPLQRAQALTGRKKPVSNQKSRRLTVRLAARALPALTGHRAYALSGSPYRISTPQNPLPAARSSSPGDEISSVPCLRSPLLRCGLEGKIIVWHGMQTEISGLLFEDRRGPNTLPPASNPPVYASRVFPLR